jgi:hypothetical protein
MPSKAECALIKAAAAAESQPKLKATQVDLCPGLRHNVDEDSVSESINIALVTKMNDGTWGDTDLADTLDWSNFLSGVPLTEDGRAIVDFYIRSNRNSEDDEGLYGNVTVHFSNGRLETVKGYSISEHFNVNDA